MYLCVPYLYFLAINDLACFLNNVQLAVMDLEGEVKPPSSTEESTVRPEAEEEEQFKGEDVAHLESKKPTDSDDEEPPPPYTTYDPQEEKTDEKKDSPEGAEEGGASRGLSGGEGHPHNELRQSQNEPSDATEVENPAVENQNQNPSFQEEQPKLIPESSLGFSYQGPSSLIQSDDGVSSREHDQPQQHRSKPLGSGSGSKSDNSPRPLSSAAASINSPTSLSRLSSPERKLTLSEMTRITPEDESRLNLKPHQMPVPSPTSAATTSAAAVLSQVDPSTPVSSLGSPSKVSNQTPDLANSPSSPDVSNIPSSVSTSSAENSQGNAPAVPSTSSSSSSMSSGLKFSAFLSKGKGKQKKQDKLSKSPGSGSSGKSSKKKSKGKNVVSTSTTASTEQKNSQSSQSPLGSSWVAIPSSSASSSSPVTQTQNLKVGGSASQQPLTNSQESFVDGFSPELSDHSNEVDTSPQEAQILSAGYSLGMQVSVDTKNSWVVVKSVSSGGAVGRNGRIRVGDKIEAVNGESVADLSLTKVKQILKKASKANEFTITYTPSLVAASPHFSLPPQPNPPAASSSLSANSATNKDSPPGYDKSSATKTSMLESKKSGDRGSSSSKEGVAMGGSSKSKAEVYYSQLPSMVASLHDQELSHQVSAPGGGPSMPMHAPQGGGATGGGVVSGSHMMQPPPPPSQAGGSMGSWMDGGGVSPYHQMQGYYGGLTMEDQIGKPPPPYMFPHHQGQPGTAGRMMGGQSPYNHISVGGQGPPTHPSTGMSWQLPHPQGMNFHFKPCRSQLHRNSHVMHHGMEYSK